MELFLVKKWLCCFLEKQKQKPEEILFLSTKSPIFATQNNSNMKKIIIIAAFFSVLSITKASAQFQGTFGMGAHTVFGTETNSVGAGLHIHYYWTNNLRMAPSATFFIPQNDVRMWKAEFDLHVVAPLTFSTVVYPIVGVSFTNRRSEASPQEEDVPSWTNHHFGGNFGVGIQHDIMYRLRVNFEIKHHMIRDRSQVGIMVGIGFWI